TGHRGKPDNSLVLERETAIRHEPGEFGSGPDPEFAVDPRQMGLNRGDGREVLRGNLAVRLAEGYERSNSALCLSQVAVAPWTRPSRSQLGLAALDPARCSELEEHRARPVEHLSRAAPLSRAAQRLPAGEQRAAGMQWKAESL